jgi:hypothetical protein
MTALIRFNEAICPSCLKVLCRVAKDARAHGIELWCKTCRAPVLLDLEEKNKL